MVDGVVEEILQSGRYFTAMVTGGLLCPAMLSTTGRAFPGLTPEGTTTLTWYKSGNPGASPANFTSASIPPIVTVNGFAVLNSAPSATTAPRPLQYSTTT